MQGTVKQGLHRQKEAYSGKWRDLEEKARGLEDTLRSVRQAVSEREEQNAGLDSQVCLASLLSAAAHGWTKHQRAFVIAQLRMASGSIPLAYGDTERET